MQTHRRPKFSYWTGRQGSRPSSSYERKMNETNKIQCCVCAANGSFDRESEGKHYHFSLAKPQGGQVGGDVEYCGGAKRPKTTTVHWSIESLLVLQTCLGPTITFCNVGAITLLLTCGARCKSMGNIEERRALLLSSHGIPLQTYKET